MVIRASDVAAAAGVSVALVRKDEVKLVDLREVAEFIHMHRMIEAFRERRRAGAI